MTRPPRSQPVAAGPTPVELPVLAICPEGGVCLATRLALFFLLMIALILGCAPPAKEGEAGTPPMDKIAFDLNLLNQAGLYGPPDGLRAMSYEFCIPGVDSCEQQVRNIDPSVVVHRGGRGRIGCSEEQFLCVGSTGQPEYRRVIVDLAKLSYVDRIEPAYFE